jgi:hypothetical protein
MALVDDEDYLRISKHKWCALKVGKKWYAVRRETRNDKSLFLYMHRELLNLDPGDVRTIDHRDENGCNNQRGNLRFATKAQNAMNTGPPLNSSTGIKGVSYDFRSARPYRAYITVQRRQLSLGRYLKLSDAAQARAEAALYYYGDYAPKTCPKENCI